MNDVLITGASGFVGQNLINYLDKRLISHKEISLRSGVPDSLPGDTSVVVHLAGLAHDLKNVHKEADYFHVNTELTQRLFQAFLRSEANTFIFISSVKAVADSPGKELLLESTIPSPVTVYGKSKLEAERALLNHKENGKRIIILRPCMIHGQGNKGNLNLLYRWVKSGLPYPLGAFENERSYLSVDHLCYVITELILDRTIPQGVYQVADTNYVSTIELIKLISQEFGIPACIWKIPAPTIKMLAKMGDWLHLPLNSERLKKLTDDYKVSNEKLRSVLENPPTFEASAGLRKTIRSFAHE
ncbi:NAD-dependent epimerase/dehydratase family protein [Jiulongibacter sp. NS-SX5]|uniref:NAD-dependent epimerase/dehydratase family protein n=1 Tax=Jiulongibacter sp. NS-SX5 TaxID=3463854 RepID=UPI0040585984